MRPRTLRLKGEMFRDGQLANTLNVCCLPMKADPEGERAAVPRSAED